MGSGRGQAGWARGPSPRLLPPAPSGRWGPVPLLHPAGPGPSGHQPCLSLGRSDPSRGAGWGRRSCPCVLAHGCAPQTPPVLPQGHPRDAEHPLGGVPGVEGGCPGPQDPGALTPPPRRPEDPAVQLLPEAAHLPALHRPRPAGRPGPGHRMVGDPRAGPLLGPLPGRAGGGLCPGPWGSSFPRVTPVPGRRAQDPAGSAASSPEAGGSLRAPLLLWWPRGTQGLSQCSPGRPPSPTASELGRALSAPLGADSSCLFPGGRGRARRLAGRLVRGPRGSGARHPQARLFHPLLRTNLPSSPCGEGRSHPGGLRRKTGPRSGSYTTFRGLSHLPPPRGSRASGSASPWGPGPF